MTVWQNPKKMQNNNVWVNPKRAQESQPRKPFPGEGLGLGLAQALENKIKGLTSHGAEPEVDIPDFMRHPKLANRPETNRSPSFNFEQYVDPSQHLQFKAGEYAPEIVGAGLGVGAGIKGLSKLTSKSIGKSIVKDVKGIKSGLNKEYNSFFDKAEQKGLNKIDISGDTLKNMENVLANVTDKKYYQALEKAIDNPTARNVHFAQSDLGKFIRKWKDNPNLPSPVYDALRAANEAQTALKNDLYKGFLNKGGLEMPFEYSKLSEKYAKNLVPYLENTSVRKALLKPGQKGYINPKRLPGKLKLQQSDPLMAHLRGKKEGTNLPINEYLQGKYPLLGVNKILMSPILKYGLVSSGLGASTYGGYRLLESLLGKS